jgi:hypothetical protein
MNRSFLLVVMLLATCSTAGAPLTISAQERHPGAARNHPAIPRHRAPGFYGRQYHSFSLHERRIWHGGRWVRQWHDGRFAWWWVAGGWWYVYPEPIYPYPRYVPPAVVVEQAPPQPAGLPPIQYWYFCDDPEGYYPYVASCNASWRPVPAQPQQ